MGGRGVRGLRSSLLRPIGCTAKWPLREAELRPCRREREEMEDEEDADGEEEEGG